MTAPSPERHNASWLDRLERPALLWMAVRLPGWATPDGLTAVGFLGALVAAGGYALAGQYRVALFGASAGLVVNWFGDSLDGTLARVRGIERPRYGYILDNSVDLVTELLIAIGFGLSGLIRWDLCFLALSALLLMSCLSLLRTVVSGVHRLAYAGIGLTEMRLALVAFNLVLVVLPPEQLGGLHLPMTYPNLASLAWSVGTLVVFVFSAIAQVREVGAEDPPR